MTYYDKYTNFRINRVKFWQPKLRTALQGIADNILQQPTIEEAIQAAHGLQPMSELAGVIKNMYIDAGRVMGAYAYQEVRKQAREKRIKPVATKALLPMGYNDQLVADIIQYYQTNLLSEAVIPITQNLRDYILAKLIEAQQQGNSITTVVDFIETAGMARNRAFLIARTETVKAANYGAKQGAIMTGHAMNKVWTSAQQNRTRRIPRDKADHLHMNNVEAAMDEPFNVPDKNGVVKMDRPGDSGAPAEQVINCRCCLSFRVLEPNEIRKVQPTPNNTFTPAKSLAEAERYLEEKHGIKYDKTAKGKTSLNLDAVNIVNKRMDYLLSNYSKEKLSFIGIGATGNEYARAYTNGISLNSAKWNNLETLQQALIQDELTGFHPKGMTAPHTLIDHEFAHILTKQFLDGNKSNTFRDDVRKILNLYKADMNQSTKQGIQYKDNPNFVSKYAHTAEDEFVAESFMMALNSDNPSKYAVMIKDLIDKLFKL